MEAYLSTLTSINEQIQLYDGLTNINNEWDSRAEMLFSLKTCLNIAIDGKNFYILRVLISNVAGAIRTKCQTNALNFIAKIKSFLTHSLYAI